MEKRKSWRRIKSSRWIDRMIFQEPNWPPHPRWTLPSLSDARTWATSPTSTRPVCCTISKPGGQHELRIITWTIFILLGSKVKHGHIHLNLSSLDMWASWSTHTAGCSAWRSTRTSGSPSTPPPLSRFTLGKGAMRWDDWWWRTLENTLTHFLATQSSLYTLRSSRVERIDWRAPEL